MKTRLLTSDAIGKLVVRHGLDRLMDDLIARLERALIDFDEAVVSTPVRSGFSSAAGLLEWMPCRIEERGSMMKMVGYHPTNPSLQALPTILSSTFWFDGRSGHLLAMADATFLTALRTGAASAVASRIMAHPRSSALGVIGCGAQAVSQIHALARVFPLECVIAYDIHPSAAKSLASRCSFLDLRFETVDSSSLDHLLDSADILCTCTSTEPGTGPVFRDRSTLRPHLHINAVGSDFPGKFEVPHSFLRRAVVVPDFSPQAIVEGECQQLDPSEIGPSLAAIVRQPDSWSHLHDAFSVFDSTGWAYEDAVAFNLLLELSQEYQIGSEVNLACVAADPRDPYGFLQPSPAQPKRDFPAHSPAPA